METTTPKCQCGEEMKPADFYCGMAGASICTKEKYAMNRYYKVNAWYCPECGKVELYAKLPSRLQKL